LYFCLNITYAFEQLNVLLQMNKLIKLTLAGMIALGAILPASAQKSVELPEPSSIVSTEGEIIGGSNDAGTIYYGAVPANAGTKPVLVFIHGYNSSAKTWWDGNDMYNKAFADGYRTAFVSVHPDQNMWTNGQMFAGMLNTICAKYGVSRVVVIAHSKGGVDSDAALVHYNAWNRVERVITLGTPHFGTPLADLASSGWTSWLGAIFGQNNNATKSLQTGTMAAFRNQTDPHPNRPRTVFRTFGGWRYNGWLWTSGVYLSWNGGGSSQGGNDGVVNYTSTRRPNSTVVFGVNDSRGGVNHSDIAKGTPMWQYVRAQLPSSLTREMELEQTPARYNPTAIVKSNGEFIAADRGARSFSAPRAQRVKITIYQAANQQDADVTVVGNATKIISTENNEEGSNTQTIIFEQANDQNTYTIRGENPYFAIVETDAKITATLTTDLNNDKFVYEQGEQMNFSVNLEGVAIESVTGTLLRTSDINGAEDQTQVASNLEFAYQNGKFIATQKGNLPAGVYNVSVQVMGNGGVTRSLVTSIAVVASEKATQSMEEALALEGFGAYPNPSAGATKIHFEIKESGTHVINIYDLTGRRVHQVNVSDLGEGKHQINWEADASLKNGIYLYEFESNGKKFTKKMILNR
jgi:pimeloyl-ACP methyl ester carboxylesterase